MKTSIKVILAALTISAFAFDGCKKGPDDPFMSLHTRKGRMDGDWKVSAGSGSFGSSASTTTWTYDGASYKETDASGTTTTAETITMNFEKDGTYKMVTTITDTQYSDVTTATGTWNFTGKIGDDKNKDHVVMKELVSTEVETIASSSTTTTTTRTGDDASTSIMYIDELKNKEIMFTWDGTTAQGSNSQFDKGSWTLTPQ